MRYLALASDYDDTLAKGGQLRPSTIEALEKFRATGRKTILVTGREIQDLRNVCTRLELFDLIVGENGGVLLKPGDSVLPLSRPASTALIQSLQSKGITPLSSGKVVIATLSRFHETVRSCIQELGLDLRIILNKGSLMILPSGVHKASGLKIALNMLGIPASATWAIGDAENDVDFLFAAGHSAAVANALPLLKEKSHWVATAEAGEGVEELIEMILSEDA